MATLKVPLLPVSMIDVLHQLDKSDGFMLIRPAEGPRSSQSFELAACVESETMHRIILKADGSWTASTTIEV